MPTMVPMSFEEPYRLPEAVATLEPLIAVEAALAVVSLAYLTTCLVRVISAKPEPPESSAPAVAMTAAEPPLSMLALIAETAEVLLALATSTTIAGKVT